jgi:hypothetical protein
MQVFAELRAGRLMLTKQRNGAQEWRFHLLG